MSLHLQNCMWLGFKSHESVTVLQSRLFHGDLLSMKTEKDSTLRTPATSFTVRSEKIFAKRWACRFTHKKLSLAKHKRPFSNEGRQMTSQYSPRKWELLSISFIPQQKIIIWSENGPRPPFSPANEERERVRGRERERVRERQRERERGRQSRGVKGICPWRRIPRTFYNTCCYCRYCHINVAMLLLNRN